MAHYVVAIQVQRVDYQAPSMTRAVSGGEPKRTITELAKIAVRESEFTEAIRKGVAHLELTGDTVTDDTREEDKVYRS